MMAGHAGSAQFRRSGLSLLPPAAALAALAAAVGGGEPAVVAEDGRAHAVPATTGLLGTAAVH
ncbi:hypothetical protein, partial [Streptomyces sp. BE303]|uniref:hypothetical protein n=1 Tax=Streptomyces sp. BE303 TaxID=3002528 RepID=UPI002E75FA12